jgi:hypothetical protein
VKFPSKSEMVPMEVPFQITLAPETESCVPSDDGLIIIPSILSWAKMKIGKK